jgi:quinol-cytochrome oxidoreductase complex cytochrome b subunit
MSSAIDVPAPRAQPQRGRLSRWWGVVEEQFAIRQLVREYLIPVEANNIWYTLGGVLAIALGLEILTGALLSLVYQPDAATAYDTTKHLIETPGWSVVLNFHYWTAYVIFGLVMIHMMRVFITGGYRRGKQGLWLIGVGLAALTFVVSLTGETLHWDEVGFAVPWHISETLDVFGLTQFFSYTFDDLKDIPTATEKLGQIYALHVSIVPILLLGFIGMHYLLIRLKGISVPFWIRSSGRTAPFTEHIRAWVLWSAIILGAVLLIAIFVPRDPGVAPQLLPSSPYYGSEHGPGGLGAKPTFPISWTHGMNVFVADWLGIEPDIWGTISGMVLMLGALLIIPFVDRGAVEPASSAAAFNWRERGWAFVAIAIFWLVMIIGVVQNALSEAG